MTIKTAFITGLHKVDQEVLPWTSEYNVQGLKSLTSSFIADCIDSPSIYQTLVETYEGLTI